MNGLGISVNLKSWRLAHRHCKCPAHFADAGRHARPRLREAKLRRASMAAKNTGPAWSWHGFPPPRGRRSGSASDAACTTEQSRCPDFCPCSGAHGCKSTLRSGSRKPAFSPPPDVNVDMPQWPVSAKLSSSDLVFFAVAKPDGLTVRPVQPAPSSFSTSKNSGVRTTHFKRYRPLAGCFVHRIKAGCANGPLTRLHCRPSTR